MPRYNEKTILKVLKQLQSKKKMSLNQVADANGVPRSSLQYWVSKRLTAEERQEISKRGKSMCGAPAAKKSAPVHAKPKQIIETTKPNTGVSILLDKEGKLISANAPTGMSISYFQTT